jgi:heme o synthase
MSAYWRLIRPGLLMTALFSMTIGALASAEPPPLAQLAHALLGVGLLIAGASAMNQLVERRLDASMKRTASRPLPTGRLTTWQAAVFAACASVAGVGWLAMVEPPAATILAMLGWIIYVLIYTPLKRRSVWHMPPGAVAGAIPVLLGAAMSGAMFTRTSLTLAGIVFFWQFPHTAAIGWIYRDQYACGEVKVAAVADPTGRLAGWLAFFGAAGLLLASLVPIALLTVGWPYLVIALLLGVTHAVVAAMFLADPTDAHARALWRMSLVHLPVLLTSLAICLTPCPIGPETKSKSTVFTYLDYWDHFNQFQWLTQNQTCAS